MFRAACVVALCMAAISAVLAQGYPNKPIRLLIGYSPGGSAEAGARPLARALEPLLGQPLVFEYRPGRPRKGTVRPQSPDGDEHVSLPWAIRGQRRY